MNLPGETTPRQRLARMVRVDHAGEYGAKRIYQGQLAVLGHGPKGDILRHMQAQEQHHLDTFSNLIADRHVRPTALLPFWHVAGFVLGAATAALGERAAMACTVAVEEAIDEHYRAQSAELDDSEADLRARSKNSASRNWSTAISASPMTPSAPLSTAPSLPSSKPAARSRSRSVNAFDARRHTKHHRMGF